MVQFMEYCFRTPLITCIYYGMLSLAHSASYFLMLEDLKSNTWVDLALLGWIVVTILPECALIYIGMNKVKLGFLIAAIFLLLQLWIVFAYLYIKLTSFKHLWGKSAKYMMSFVLATLHMAFMPIALSAMVLNAIIIGSNLPGVIMVEGRPSRRRVP
uniref:Uncharacterized protein n=2 Tax=Rhodnius prolixus TaxID=13249 RepID=T1HH92_RHOPR